MEKRSDTRHDSSGKEELEEGKGRSKGEAQGTRKEWGKS